MQVRVLYDGQVMTVGGRSVMSLDAFEKYVKPYTVSQQEHQDTCWPGTTAATTPAPSEDAVYYD